MFSLVNRFHTKQDWIQYIQKRKIMKFGNHCKQSENSSKSLVFNNSMELLYYEDIFKLAHHMLQPS